MPRLKTDTVHATIREDIKNTARRIMAAEGAAGLSLRAIARALDVTAPALYRYYPSLDELITALILDGFNGLADAMQAALDSTTQASAQSSFRAVLTAYQAWALTHTIEYTLIYGSPIPGYTAPSNITVPAAIRIFIMLVLPLQRAIETGELVLAAPYNVAPAEQTPILTALLQQNAYPTTPEAVYAGFVCFARLYGLVMPAVLGHLVPLDTSAFFSSEIAALCWQLGFKPEQ